MNIKFIFTEAMQHLQTRDFVKAASGFSSITRGDPTNFPAWINLAIALRGNNDLNGSLQAYERAELLDPNLPALWYNKGNLCIDMGRMHEAAHCFLRAITLAPTYEAAHTNLGVVLSQLTTSKMDVEDLIASWEKLSGDNPLKKHYIAALRGNDSGSTAREFVERHFDNFAETFDERLSALNYQTPQLMSQLIGTLQPMKGVTLDAGCGTGLCGPMLRPLSSQLIGVDLSGEMLKKAASRGIYDALVRRDIIDFLTDRAFRNEQFDLIVAADVLIYFADLSNIFASVRQAMSRGGIFVFSVEKNENEHSFVINSSARYRHGERYVSTTATEAGFRIDVVRHEIARMEFGKPEHSLLFAFTAC